MRSTKATLDVLAKHRMSHPTLASHYEKIQVAVLFTEKESQKQAIAIYENY